MNNLKSRNRVRFVSFYEIKRNDSDGTFEGIMTAVETVIADLVMNTTLVILNITKTQLILSGVIGHSTIHILLDENSRPALALAKARWARGTTDQTPS